MKKTILLLLSLTACLITYADQRGVSFEKDGLIYTIASEAIVKKFNIGRKFGDPQHLYKNEGEVYVSGVAISDAVVNIPTTVSYPSSYGRYTEDTATYQVLGIGERAFENAMLKDLIIPYGLKFIGKEAFKNMELASGVLIVPPARRMGANLFDGMKSNVFITDLEDSYEGHPIQIFFYKTFEHTDKLPHIYIPHSSIGAQVNNVDKKIFYTVGENIINNWMTGRDKSQKNIRPKTISTSGNPFQFKTCNNNESPKITIRTCKKFEKTQKDIDRLPPYEFVCYNTYTNKIDVYQEFTINSSIYRGKKGNEYFYFTTEGKPITDKETLLDNSGKDPFGLQVASAEDMKTKKVTSEIDNIQPTNAPYVISNASSRGVSFEKDGLIYTIASEYTIKKDNIGRKSGDPQYIYENGGEVYVSGVTVSDSVVKIPTIVSFYSPYNDTTSYQVLGIGERAFEGARLKDLIIPYGLKFIGKEAFKNMELASGVLIVPPARRMGANLFDGMKTKVFMTELEDFYENRPIQIYFDRTFENTVNLPDIYIPHSSINTQVNNLDKKIFYTVGSDIIDSWMTGKELKKYVRPNTLKLPVQYKTFNNIVTPRIIIIACKNFEKVNRDLDRLPPYEFVCYNTYTNKTDVYQEFIINNSIYRGKKGNKYYYFTTDGKPIINKETLLDDSGKDPFGLQVISAEELKARKEAKEREKNLNKKLNDLKSTFGF